MDLLGRKKRKLAKEKLAAEELAREKLAKKGTLVTIYTTAERKRGVKREVTLNCGSTIRVKGKKDAYGLYCWWNSEKQGWVLDQDENPKNL